MLDAQYPQSIPSHSGSATIHHSLMSLSGLPRFEGTGVLLNTVTETLERHSKMLYTAQ